MYNIKLKSVPNKAKTGSQLDYSLVDRNTLFLKPNTPVDSDVKNTMGAVPRDKANIEAEGGETVVGDINNDGYLEHQTIVGKRHSQGGVPLNVPEGSFIFSDTKKMTIKDPEVLVMFGMKPSKAGYTPAEIAKKYNINDYMSILKDDAKDKYAKETAQIMLQSNLKKLGMLALIQESMKGFPDGVPAIAESIMGQMQGEQPQEEMQESPEQQEPQEEMQEEQPMQRFGGTQLPKAQVGSGYTGKTIYIHNQPFVVGAADTSRISGFGNMFLGNENKSIYPVKGVDTNGKEYVKYMSQSEINAALKSSPYKRPGNYQDRSVTESWNYSQAKPFKAERNLNKKLKIQTGDDLVIGDKSYKVINPYGEKGDEYIHSGKRWRDAFDNTEGIIHVLNDKGEEEFIEGEDIKEAYSVDPNLVKIKRGNIYQAKNKAASDVNKASTSAPKPLNFSNAPEPIVDTTSTSNRGTATQEAAQRAAAVRNAAANAQAAAARVQQQQRQQPAEQPRIKVRIKAAPAQTAMPASQNINGIEVETDPNLAYGGNVHQYKFQGDVGGSTVTAPQVQTQAPAPTKKIVKYIWGEKNQKMYAKYDDGTVAQTPYTQLVTREKYLNPQTKANEWKYYAAFPDTMSAKEKASIVDSVTDDRLLPVVTQHSNIRINKNNPYKSFYGNTKPQDYEDRIVRKNLGDEATDAMDEITKRKKAFEYLGIKGIADTDLKDAARLYNDPYFFKEQFYPAFTKTLPKGTFRQEMGDDAQMGWEHLKSIAAAPKADEAKKDENVKTSDATKPYIAPQYANTGPWIQDLNTYAGTATDNVNTYLPAMGSHNYMTHGYTLNDPTTAIRGVQQGVNSLQDQAFNSMSGNVAMAASSGLAGQGMDKAAEVAGNVNNQNVGIVNNAAASNANIFNRGVDAKASDISTYMANMSTALDNRDKALSQQKWRGIGAMNNLYTNWQKKNQYEQMFKNVTIDPVTGKRTIHGNDRALLNDDGTFGYDTYVNPWTAGSAAIDTDALIDHYMKNKSMPFEEAKARAELQLKGHAIKSGKRKPSQDYGYGASADNAYGYDS
jgi:hypothetical protein